MKDFFSMLKEFQRIKARISDLKDELREKTVEGLSGGGMVRVVVNGAQEVVSVKIEDAAFELGKDVLEDLIAAAVNDALKKSKELAEEEAKKLIQSLGIPIPIDLL